MAHGPDYARVANEQIVTLAMVETKQALDELDGIVATSGLTGVYIGPSDLSLSMGYTPKLDPEEPAVVSAIQRILETAKTAGIRAGIHCLSPAYAREMISMGFDLVTVGSDIRILTSATVAALEAVRS
jgi:4-hydroxy-2-oxoheptanedioate aldolase